MRWFYFFSFCFFLLSACDYNDSREALGTLERERIILKATANEIIVGLPVAEGTQVKKGTLIVQLDDRKQQAKVAYARAEVAKAAAFLQELRSGAREEDVDAARARVSGARAALTVAEKNYQRARQLLQQKLISQSELDRAVAERDSAEAAQESANKALLVLTNGTRQEELDQGEAAYQAVEAQLDLEQQILDELSVEATRDGYLDSLPWNEGERVQPGSTVAILLSNQSPYARVYIPEPWRARVKVGDEFPVSIDGVEKSYTGRVRWIASDPAFTPYYALNAKDRSRLVYLAELDLQDAAELPTGVPVQVMLNYE